MDADETRQALASLAGCRVAALMIGAGRSAATRQIRFPPSGMLEVLAGASGEWLVPGAAIVVVAGRRVTLLWDVASRSARQAAAARLAREVGGRRADRALRSWERDVRRQEHRQVVTA